MSRLSKIIRSLSTISKKNTDNTIFIKKVKLNINNENDYDTIKSIIHSSCGSLKFDEKNGKFYFK